MGDRQGAPASTYDVAVMIDAARSRDLDDALSVRATESGWTATVHVAAAADALVVGSDADKLARERIQTRYLPHKTIPMLGDLERAATLSTSDERGALTVTADFDRSGAVSNIGVARSRLAPASCVRVT